MGRNKLLLKLGGIAVLDRVLSSIDASRVDEVSVVLGHRPEDLKPIVNGHSAVAVLNPDYEEGMTSSFKTGLGAVSAEAAFLCLGDQAVLDPSLMDKMIEAMDQDMESLIVSPVHEGNRGHPVLFREVLFPEILGLGQEETLKDVVEGHGDRHIAVEGDIWCTLDMDTPEDYERIRGRLGAGP
jgi:molybdenum cofactor cytidylyltransferase